MTVDLKHKRILEVDYDTNVAFLIPGYNTRLSQWQTVDIADITLSAPVTDPCGGGISGHTHSLEWSGTVPLLLRCWCSKPSEVRVTKGHQRSNGYEPPSRVDTWVLGLNPLGTLRWTATYSSGPSPSFGETLSRKPPICLAY